MARNRGDAPQPLEASSKPTFTIKKAIRNIDNQSRNNTEENLKPGMNSLMIF
jgi:hypothetical protein